MQGGASFLDMAAIDGDKVQTLSSELESVLEAFEAATGLLVCLRVLSDQWTDVRGEVAAPAPYNEHRSDFCKAMKARALAACTKCDHNDLFTDCDSEQGRIRQPFVRTCYAGADEILLPIWNQGALVAVLFIGQFRTVDRLDTRGTELPVLGEDKLSYVSALGLTLLTYLYEVLRRLRADRQAPIAGRWRVIESYVRENLSAGPTLQELSQRLSLSPSRTSHVVREVTGMSFHDLVETSRLDLAKDLLTRSGATIATVASQAGFNDTGYFCRYFKQKTGFTPTGYRREYSTTPLI